MLNATPAGTTVLPRMILRAVYALTESGTPPSLRSLLAIVPAPADQIVATIRALNGEGYLDASRMRLTMRGLALACAPHMVATDRRRAPRDRKWAGAIDRSNETGKPGLRKAAIVA
jgi:hypothetical protein